MAREIEADGFITRDADLKQTKPQTCLTCKHFRYGEKGGICVNGASLFCEDWRMKYQVCDKWEGLNGC